MTIRNWMPAERIRNLAGGQDLIVMDFGGPLMYLVDPKESDKTAFMFQEWDLKKKGIEPRQILRLDSNQGKKLMLWLMMGALS